MVAEATMLNSLLRDEVYDDFISAHSTHESTTQSLYLVLQLFQVVNAVAIPALVLVLVLSLSWPLTHFLQVTFKYLLQVFDMLLRWRA